ncbi:MAG TPA: hypothetical protein PLZ08_11815, partial [Bacillota bacterium]|nr:hypothetical protein [Bacillota bacterium]HPO98624.1 hypothetical protein [Bacillota bacterium]
ECLPFLDISQLMAMIFSNQLTSNLSIERYDGVFRCLVAGEEFENENLCDLLWEAVKKML